MGPKKNTKKAIGCVQLDLTSPQSKRKLTINSKASMRRGINLMLAINAVADEPLEGYTPYQAMCLERHAIDEVTEKPFEALAKTRRLQIRQKGKKSPTLLNQDEWEELTSLKLVNSVIVMQPDPRVGELLRKASMEEKAEFAAHLAKREAEAKKHGVQSVEEFMRVRKAEKAAAKVAAKAAAAAAAADRMEPEF